MNPKKDRSRKPSSLAINPDRIPDELKVLPQWVRWRWDWDEKRKAWTKKPIHPSRNRLASTTNPTTWGTFKDALEGVGRYGTDGIGFVFTADDPYCGVDLDSCRNPERGEVAAAAKSIVRSINSYTEASPTGTGLHTIAKAALPNGVGKKGEWLEIYDRGRYFAFTGAAIEMFGIQERQIEVERLLAEFFRGRAQRGRPSSTNSLAIGVDEGDDRIIDLASKAKNGAKFSKLFTGDTSDYPSASEADFAFSLLLAFWTRKNAAWIDRLFRRSGLFREKWDERHHSNGSTYGQETVARAVAACDETYQAGIREMPLGWERDLLWRVGRLGEPQFLERVVANVLLILRNHESWKGVLAFDEFSYCIVLLRPPPYRPATFSVSPDGVAWTDSDDVLTAAWLNREYRLFVGVETVRQAVLAAAGDNAFHPVRSYLSGLTWDGRPRIETWLIDFLGADDTAYVRAVSTRWLISAVARILLPGTKVDHVLILEGNQGLLKSTALRMLAPKWFTDELDAIGSKDAAGQLLGVWIVELAELDALGRAEIARVKAFLSKTFDRYRPSYGRHVVRFERQCVFAGTVNHAEYLKDETGNRRFWPVRCSGISGIGRADIEGLARDRDQLWAEAVSRYRAGEKWWLETRSLVVAAAKEQDDRFQGDVWEHLIQRFVEGRSAVTVGEILADLGIETGKQGQVEQNRVARCLLRLKWFRAQRHHTGRKQWVYVPPSPLEARSPVSTPQSGSTKEAEFTGKSPVSPLSPVGPQENLKINEEEIGDIEGFYGGAGDTGSTGDTGSAPSCFACRGTDFWTNSVGEPICRRCHPPNLGVVR